MPERASFEAADDDDFEVILWQRPVSKLASRSAWGATKSTPSLPPAASSSGGAMRSQRQTSMTAFLQSQDVGRQPDRTAASDRRSEAPRTPQVPPPPPEEHSRDHWDEWLGLRASPPPVPPAYGENEPANDFDYYDQLLNPPKIGIPPPALARPDRRAVPPQMLPERPDPPAAIESHTLYERNLSPPPADLLEHLLDEEDQFQTDLGPSPSSQAPSTLGRNSSEYPDDDDGDFIVESPVQPMVEKKPARFIFKSLKGSKTSTGVPERSVVHVSSARDQPATQRYDIVAPAVPRAQTIESDQSPNRELTGFQDLNALIRKKIIFKKPACYLRAHERDELKDLLIMCLVQKIDYYEKELAPSGATPPPSAIGEFNALIETMTERLATPSKVNESPPNDSAHRNGKSSNDSPDFEVPSPRASAFPTSPILGSQSHDPERGERKFQFKPPNHTLPSRLELREPASSMAMVRPVPLNCPSPVRTSTQCEGSRSYFHTTPSQYIDTSISSPIPARTIPQESLTRRSTPYIEPDNFDTQPALNATRQPDINGDIYYTDALYSSQTSEAGTEVDGFNTEGRFLGNARNDGNDKLLSRRDFAFSEQLFNHLRNKFGIHKFRPNQLQTCNAALLSKDCFVLMPTGGGKSLCYQLPAVLSEGITVVISPLVSLIHDQVTKLNGLGIPADHLSGEDYTRQRLIYDKLRFKKPGLTLLYVTPEKISASEGLKSIFTQLHSNQMLSRFVIDEAHCVSQWGHDFRPDYKQLKILRTKYPGVPFMALTATATPRVRTDILHQLGMREPKWFLSSFNRINLQYEVRPKKGKSITKDIIELIQKEYPRQSGIVYCLSRKECDDVADDLSQNGISAAAYHAGLKENDRSSVQDRWIQDKTRVVCATIAFGMGIDKPDVRFVVHYSLPKSIEGYYQESGRAGRDGRRSKCILFYSYADFHRMRKLIDLDEKATIEARKIHYTNLYSMVGYCENISDCRRAIQLQYFGEVFDPQLCRSSDTPCDNCRCSTKTKVDVTVFARTVVEGVIRLSMRPRFDQKNFTINHLVDILRGMKNKKVLSCQWDQDPIYKTGAQYNIQDCNRIVRRLVLENYLWEELVISRDGMASAYVKKGNRADQLLSGACQVELDVNAPKLVHAKAGEAEPDDTLRRIEEKCFETLKEVVLSLYPDLKSAFVALPVEVYQEIAKNLPTTPEQMLDVDQMTRIRLDKFGVHLLTVCQSFREDRMKYLADKQIAQMAAVEEEKEFNEANGYNAYGSPASSTTKRRGQSRYFRGGTTSKRGRGRGSYNRAASSSSRGGARGGKRAASRGRPPSLKRKSDEAPPHLPSTSRAKPSGGGSHGGSAMLLSIPKPRPGLGGGRFAFQ